MRKVSLNLYYIFCIVANCKDYKEASKKLNISEVTIKKKLN